MMDKEKLKTYVIVPILFVGIALMFITPVKNALSMEKGDVPLVNDAWANALQAIHDDSENNPGKPWEKGIITSWWDFGHHFKYLSDRAVTFDGGTQVTPQAHWVGELLLSSDEDKSINILRMLDCGGNTAFDKINSIINDTPVSIKILEGKFSNPRGSISQGLGDFNDIGVAYPLDDPRFALNVNLFCTPTSGYIIASEDMIGKAGVWGHFGLWDFNRADMWINAKKLPKDQAIDYILKKNHTSSESEAEKLWAQLQTMTESEANNWLAPWPGYASHMNCRSDNVSINCDSGIKINILPDGGLEAITPIPVSLVYKGPDNKIVEKRYSNSSLPYSMIYAADGSLTLSSPELANSLFTKMFLFEGYGLEHFTLLKKTQNIDGFKIYVYKVNWD